jgi:hypothetical protein
MEVSVLFRAVSIRSRSPRDVVGDFLVVMSATSHAGAIAIGVSSLGGVVHS